MIKFVAHNDAIVYYYFSKNAIEIMKSCNVRTSILRYDSGVTQRWNYWNEIVLYFFFLRWWVSATYLFESVFDETTFSVRFGREFCISHIRRMQITHSFFSSCLRQLVLEPGCTLPKSTRRKVIRAWPWPMSVLTTSFREYGHNMADSSRSLMVWVCYCWS